MTEGNMTYRGFDIEPYQGWGGWAAKFWRSDDIDSETGCPNEEYNTGALQGHTRESIAQVARRRIDRIIAAEAELETEGKEQ